MRVHIIHVPIWALLCVVSVLAWIGWHRPPVVQHDIVNNEVQHVTHEQGPVQVVEHFVNVPYPVMQVVTAPTETTRVIVSPPVVVQNPEKVQAEEKIAFDITHICIHPDASGLPDPTCGAPVAPHMLIVRNGAGATVVQSPDDARNTVVSPVTTTLQVPKQADPSKWALHIEVGATTTLQTYASAGVEYSLLGPVSVGVRYTHMMNGGPMQDFGQVYIGATIHF